MGSVVWGREGEGRKGKGGSGDGDGYVDTAQYMQPYMSAVAQFVQSIKLRQVFLHGQNVNQSRPPQTGECMHRVTHIRTYSTRSTLQRRLQIVAVMSLYP